MTVTAVVFGPDVEQRLTQLLGGWALGSVTAGAALWLRPGPNARRSLDTGRGPDMRRGFGRQTLAWGAVDGAIALVGARRRARTGPTAPRRLRRILLLNAGVDVGYLAAGSYACRRTRWPGDGAALLVQGAFLLLLDTAAARALRS